MGPILSWNEVALEANRVSQTNVKNEQPGPTLSSRVGDRSPGDVRPLRRHRQRPGQSATLHICAAVAGWGYVAGEGEGGGRSGRSHRAFDLVPESDFVWWRTPKVTLFCDSSWLPLGASLTNHLGAYSGAS